MVRDFEIKIYPFIRESDGTSIRRFSGSCMTGYVSDIYFTETLSANFIQDLNGMLRYNWDGTEKTEDELTSELEEFFVSNVLRRPDYEKRVRSKKLNDILG